MKLEHMQKFHHETKSIGPATASSLLALQKRINKVFGHPYRMQDTPAMRPTKKPHD